MTTQSSRIGVTITGTFLLSLILFVALFANSGNETIKSVRGGGVILTFDDDTIVEWFDANRKLSKYKWKATFFVSEFYSLQAEEINRLKILQSVGHEIASHGYNHINAQEFISSHSPEKYIENEILPSINAMKDEGFDISTFAYPFGATIRFNLTEKISYVLSGNKINTLDKMLLEHFDIIRKTTYKQRAPSQQINFANGSRIVFGLGTDVIYENEVEYLLNMLQYAKENDKIVIFYGHRIASDKEDSKYTTDVETLKKICRYVENNDMRFMTMKDLVRK